MSLANEADSRGTPLAEARVISGRARLAVTIALAGLLLLSVFRHISHPLLWNDEGMTAMHAKRVLQFGFPKASDGRNVVADLAHPDAALAIDERTGAFIGGAGWGQYYIGAPAVKLAELVPDLYAKTAILRSWFAFLGWVGVGMFGSLAQARSG